MNTAVQPPEHLELTETYAYYQPVAEVSLEEAIELVDNAIRYCREHGIGGLMADVRGLTGFPSPSVTDRFWFASRWAETSNGKVVVAMVQRPEMTMPDKIGVTFAMNRGLLVDVFTEKEDASKWLAAACK